MSGSSTTITATSIAESASSRRISIASILIAVIALVTSGVLGVAGLVGYGVLKSHESIQLEETGQAMAEQAATGLSLPLWNYDESQVRKAAESIMRLEAVRGVVVRQGRDHSLFVAVVRGDSGQVRTWAHPTSEFADRVHSNVIVFAGDTIGSVEVVVSANRLEHRLSQIRIWMWSVVILVALLLSGSLYLMLWMIALRPIKILEQYSKQVNGGSFENSIARSNAFHGELDSLRGSIVRMVGLLEERFQRLREETRRYRESEKRFRTLLNTIPDLIWLKDVDGIYLSCNRRFEGFFGATETEIVGKTDYDFVTREQADFFRANDCLAMEAGAPSQNEEWVVFACDNHKTLLETTKTPMYDAEGKLVGVLGVGRDITARRKAEEERRDIDERMNNNKKLEALGVMVAGVAHNINNVLAAILGSASLREVDAVQPEDRETYAMIATASRRGRDVVRSLLQFSRPTLSNQAPLELNGLLTEVVKLLASTARNRVEFAQDLAKEELWLMGDAGSITNSFMNLCINALDAMPEGGVITLGSKSDGKDWIEAWVQDTGSGMSPQIVARVLEPFFTTKDVGKGTGLGLSMTHGVVKVHGGTMEISSEPGRGTVVRIRVPRIAAPGNGDEVSKTASRTASLHVLLVDDDPDIRFLVTRMLKKKGHQVDAVAGGQEAIDRLGREDLPDLVIMDQNMPGMDGIQTMERIRAIHPDLPILISSGQPDIQEWECFKKPKVGVISKPFDLEELEAKLKAFSEQQAEISSGV